MKNEFLLLFMSSLIPKLMMNFLGIHMTSMLDLMEEERFLGIFYKVFKNFILFLNYHQEKCGKIVFIEFKINICIIYMYVCVRVSFTKKYIIQLFLQEEFDFKTWRFSYCLYFQDYLRVFRPQIGSPLKFIVDHCNT